MDKITENELKIQELEVRFLRFKKEQNTKISQLESEINALETRVGIIEGI